jgi:superfamily II DNA or RNA helicase
MYGCYPEDLFRTLGIGTVIIDEVHQHLHAVYRFCINLHVPRLVALSATFVSDDPTIKKVQHMMFPKEIRFDNLAFDKNIRTFAICYNFKKMYGIRTSEYGSNTYSHMAFELSIIRNRDLLRSYMEMIYYVVKVGYLKDMDGRDKLIIFAARIEMCTKIVEFLRAKHPELDIRRYCEDDPYENIIDSQICVSTIQSGGTAIDIPELRVAIMTTNVSGPIPNLQALGRLRKLPDRDVKFYYLFCEQIPKQVNYHRTKKELFQDKVASIKEFKHPYQV